MKVHDTLVLFPCFVLFFALACMNVNLLNLSPLSSRIIFKKKVFLSDNMKDREEGEKDAWMDSNIYFLVILV